MKHLLTLLSILLIGGLFIQCSEQKAPTFIGDETNTALSKANHGEDEFDYDLDWDPPYTNCVTGASMQEHGLIKVHLKYITTPSGTYIEEGHVDYKAYGEVTLENLSNGDIWTLQNAEYPWSFIDFSNGSLRYHFQWNEVYKLGNQTLHIHTQGFLTVDKNGNVTRYISDYFCN